MREEPGMRESRYSLLEACENGTFHDNLQNKKNRVRVVLASAGLALMANVDAPV